MPHIIDRPNAQIFQHRKFAIYENKNVLHRNGHLQADPAHAITVLQGKHDTLYIVRRCAVAIVSVEVIYGDRKRR